MALEVTRLYRNPTIKTVRKRQGLLVHEGVGGDALVGRVKPAAILPYFSIKLPYAATLELASGFRICFAETDLVQWRTSCRCTSRRRRP